MLLPDPDNYTDQATFLEHLQRNPRVLPYDFWPLVADFTVIVQHVCSVIIFIVCFVGIFQERVSPLSIVSWGSAATFIGWLLWDWWIAQEPEPEADGPRRPKNVAGVPREPRTPRESMRPDEPPNVSRTHSLSTLPSATSSTSNLYQPVPQRPGFNASSNSVNLIRASHSTSAVSLVSSNSGSRQNPSPPAGGSKHRPSSPLRTGRGSLRVSSIKSAILIYFTLLGLSPILKSLTRSTSSDSIWSMSFWLLSINIFFFDYSSTWTGANNFPVASLSTNAALMASTVLASRLPSTGQVFSLTLFSIEVFGLFPVFRRLARHRSWRYHVLLTVMLVIGAGGGVGMILAAPTSTGGWPWKSGLLGMLVGCVIFALAVGGCSWWLIGLQKYKNEIYGPWDPARPTIISRRHWDDD